VTEVDREAALHGGKNTGNDMVFLVQVGKRFIFKVLYLSIIFES